MKNAYSTLLHTENSQNLQRSYNNNIYENNSTEQKDAVSEYLKNNRLRDSQGTQPVKN